MLTCLSVRYVMSKEQRIVLQMFCSFFVCYFFLDLGINDRANGLLAFPFLLLTIIGTFSFKDNRVEQLSRLVTFVLLVHVIFFLYQVGYWILMREYVDYLEPITGVSQRFYSLKGMLIHGIRVPRFCGLYNEPGTYSIYVFTLVAIKYLFDRRITKILLASVMSILLTLSLFGFLLVILFVVAVLIDMRRFKEFILIAMTCCIVGLFFLPEILRRLESSYSGLDIRFYSLQVALYPEHLLYGVPSSYSFDIISNDGSVFLACIMHGGAFELLLFIFFIYTVLRGTSLSTKIMLFAVLLTKIKVTYPMLYFYLACVVLSKDSAPPVSGKMSPLNEACTKIPL